jgi:hypothetical protein
LERSGCVDLLRRVSSGNWRSSNTASKPNLYGMLHSRELTMLLKASILPSSHPELAIVVEFAIVTTNCVAVERYQRLFANPGCASVRMSRIKHAVGRTGEARF